MCASFSFERIFKKYQCLPLECALDGVFNVCSAINLNFKPISAVLSDLILAAIDACADCCKCLRVLCVIMVNNNLSLSELDSQPLESGR